jgi:hypothetical protein
MSRGGNRDKEPDSKHISHNALRNPLRKPRLHHLSKPSPVAPERRLSPVDNQLPACDADSQEPASDLLQRPVSPFAKLPANIRRQIFGYLLISDSPIRLQRLWTQTMRQSGRTRSSMAANRTFIDIAIMTTSKDILEECLLLLYGANRFQYLLRDNPQLPETLKKMYRAEPKTRAAKQTQGPFARLEPPKTGRFDFYKYGHLVRHLEVVWERNRYGEEYWQMFTFALQALLRENHASENSVRLETLKLHLSPEYKSFTNPFEDIENINDDGELSKVSTAEDLTVVEHFQRNGDIVRALHGIVTHKLCLVLTTPDDNELVKTLDLRDLPRDGKVTPLCDEHPGDLLGNDRLIQDARQLRAAEAVRNLNSLHELVVKACLHTEDAISQGEWETPQDAEARQSRAQVLRDEMLVRVLRPEVSSASARGCNGNDEGVVATVKQ